MKEKISTDISMFCFHAILKGKIMHFEKKITFWLQIWPQVTEMIL